jgi:hypothetical protein
MPSLEDIKHVPPRIPNRRTTAPNWTCCGAIQSCPTLLCKVQKLFNLVGETLSAARRHMVAHVGRSWRFPELPFTTGSPQLSCSTCCPSRGRESRPKTIVRFSQGVPLQAFCQKQRRLVIVQGGTSRRHSCLLSSCKDAGPPSDGQVHCPPLLRSTRRACTTAVQRYLHLAVCRRQAC